MKTIFGLVVPFGAAEIGLVKQLKATKAGVMKAMFMLYVFCNIAPWG